MKAEKTNKIMLITGITVASTALIATAISVFNTPEAPDPNQLGPRKKLVYMSSKHFSRLPEKEKTIYIKKLGQTSMKEYRNLSQKERTALRKNTIKPKMKMLKKRMNKFFAMNKEDQDKQLDEQIAKWSKMRKRWKNRGAQNKNKKTTTNKSTSKKSSDTKKKPNRNRNAMRQYFTENMDSTTRAQMMEYWKRMKARMQQKKGK